MASRVHLKPVSLLRFHRESKALDKNKERLLHRTTLEEDVFTLPQIDLELKCLTMAGDTVRDFQLWQCAQKKGKENTHTDFRKREMWEVPFLMVTYFVQLSLIG